MKLRLQKRSEEGLQTPSEVFNWRLAVLALVASGGGVIFGYDLAFVSGVFALKSFLHRFDLTSVTATHLQTDILASFQGGAFFGVIFLYWFNERFGRRIALILAGCLFNIGVILQLTSLGHKPTFYVGRIFSGLGVGGSTFIVPQFLSENAPAVARGGLIGVFEIAVQVGSITGFWINYGVNQHISPTRDAQWQIPVGMQIVPVALMTVGLLFLNESPRWLYLKGRRSDSVRALTWLRNLPAEHPYVEHELQDYERQLEHEEDISTGKGFAAVAKEAFSPQVRFRLFLGCALQIFLNSTGVNAINYFAVSFIQALGFSGTSVKLLASGIFGVVKGVSAVITFIFLIDNFGRRKLIFAGTVGCSFGMYYLAAFSSITGSFHTKAAPNSASYSAIAFIYIYGASYSIGWNIPWILAAEIFPTRVRSFCMAWTTCFHWVGEFYTSYAVAYMIRNITYGTFLFFGSMTVLGGIFVFFYVPETNGKTLEDMDYLFESKGFARQQMRAFDEMKARQRELRAEEEKIGRESVVVQEKAGAEGTV